MTDQILALSLLAGAVVTIAGAVKLVPPVVRRVRSFVSRIGRAVDVVLGTPEVVDPDTGEVVIPARPDMGVRQARTEQLLEHAVVALVEESAANSRSAATSAAAAAQSAEAARQYMTQDHAIVHELVRKVDDLTRGQEDLSERVSQWQGIDRAKAEVATSVLHEIGMAAGQAAVPHPPRPEGT